MTDTLKQLYIKAGKADSYFEDLTPVELWRAQSDLDFKKQIFLMRPHPGYQKKDDEGNIIKDRPADVMIVERDGKRIVLGCRCISGHYRGISLFDKKITWLGPRWLNYRIPAGTPVPPSLMVTKEHKNSFGATHYTLGPKDDMPEDLFFATLKTVADHAELIK